MNWIEPITDRVKSDVDYAIMLNKKIRSGTYTQEEFDIWNSGLKGCWNMSDSERISNNLKFVANLLDINVNELSVIDLPTESWFSDLRDILDVLKTSYGDRDITDAIPENPFNTYEKLNIIETILFDIHYMITNKVFHYCGEDYYCGDSVGMLL